MENNDYTALDEVEAINGVKSLAKIAWEFNKGLREEGFKPGESIALTGQWILAICSTSSSS